MAKPDPAQLDPERYPFHCTLATRYGDVDTNRHVNNVALAGMLEDARVRYHHASGFHASMVGMGAMMGSLTIEFLGQAYYPAPLDFHEGAVALGRTSFQFQQLVMQEGRVVALASSVMICVADGRPVALPDAFRQSVQAWMITA